MPIDPESEAVAAKSFRLAAKHYHEAAERHEEVRRALNAIRDADPHRPLAADGRWKRFYQLETAADEALGNASETLCHAIQMLSPGESSERLNTAGQDWTPRGANWEGRIYTSSIGDIEDNGRPLLLIVDVAEVAFVVDEEEDEEESDEPDREELAVLTVFRESGLNLKDACKLLVGAALERAGAPKVLTEV